MPRFIIQGARKSDGMPLDKPAVISAPSENDAINLMSDRGVMVTDCKVAADPYETIVAPKHDNPSHKKEGALGRGVAWLVSGVVFGAVAAGVPLWLLLADTDDPDPPSPAQVSQQTPMVGPRYKPRLSPEVVAQRDIFTTVADLKKHMFNESWKTSNGVRLAPWTWITTTDGHRVVPTDERHQWLSSEITGKDGVQMVIFRAVIDEELDTDGTANQKIAELGAYCQATADVSGLSVAISRYLPESQVYPVKTIERLGYEFRIGIEPDPVGSAIVVAVLRADGSTSP